MFQKYRLYAIPLLLVTSLSLTSPVIYANTNNLQYHSIITTTKAELALIERPIEAIGTLSANQSIDITPQVSGRVTALNLNDGKKIKRGDLLVSLDHREQTAKVKETKVSLADQQRKLSYMNTLFQRKAVSKDELEAQQAQVNLLQATLLAEKARLDHYTLVAPFDGVLGFNNTGLGAFINSGTTLTTLDDISSVKLDIELPEAALDEVKPGTSLTAYARAWPDTTFTGTITSINPRINPQNLTFKVRAILDNSKRQLRPGMLMTINVQRPATEAIAVPSRSVLFQGNSRYVYVVGENNIAEKRFIETDLTLGDQITITKGLTPGETIVDQGVVKVRDGYPVKNLDEVVAARPDSEGDSRS
ncbi:efflux RND transporter periplasmic adaptor subunit [Endozoicomonas sp. Mp262]|uniref:efflux RND transporter periplasmic adaptor subunit n=1 Tax=Endozoicomonas sp. Mp262 TaxID=2919499 RepID=UPI0021DAD59A